MKSSIMVAAAAAGATLASTAAQAADWTGAYGGLNLGYAWSNHDVSHASDVGDIFGLGGEGCFGGEGGEGVLTGARAQAVCVDNFGAQSISIPGATRIGSFDSDGEIFGATFGINQQFGNFVIGIEADVGQMGGSHSVVSEGSVALSGIPLGGEGNPATEIGSDPGMYATVSGRFGYSFGNTLLYAKGGYGGADLGLYVLSGFSVDPPSGIEFIPIFSSNKSSFTEAWVYGAGIEHQISEKWSVKLEYMRFDFDKVGLLVRNFNTGAIDGYEIKTETDTVKVGLNWRFGEL